MIRWLLSKWRNRPDKGLDAYAPKFAHRYTFQPPTNVEQRKAQFDSADIGPAVVTAVLPRVKRAAVFPGNRNMFRYPEPDDVGCIYCPSGAGIGRWGFVCFHSILFYGARPSNKLMPTSIESFATANVDGHPCPKPLQWLQWLIGLTTLPGETVLDPFAGSGTTLRAAKDTGIKAIGIEVEQKYCDIAVRRLAQGTLAEMFQ